MSLKRQKRQPLRIRAAQQNLPLRWARLSEDESDLRATKRPLVLFPPVVEILESPQLPLDLG
jgi:hypothetical protein